MRVLVLCFLVSLAAASPLTQGLESCGGVCGRSYDKPLPCQCNDKCTKYENCCDDYVTFCSAPKAGATCDGRCGLSFDGNFPCQCNSACERYGDCCSDYITLCSGGTCTGRCDSNLDSSKPCQCNSHCVTYNDCCPDYISLCTGGTPTSNPGNGATDGDLEAVTSLLWDTDYGRISGSDLVLDLQGQTSDSGSDDVAPRPLFSHVTSSFWSRPSVVAFVALLDNYVTLQGQAENRSPSEASEDLAFLDVVMASKVMAEAGKFLIEKGYLSSTSQLREAVKRAWLDFYPRRSGGVIDSSGFEHVFVGEFKSSSVSGFHSWIQFYQEEAAGRLDYKGWVGYLQGVALGARFTWEGKPKGLGSVLLGTSPEFDLALYTVCLLTRPNALCPVKLGGTRLSVQTWDVAHEAGLQAGSAYPKF